MGEFGEWEEAETKRQSWPTTVNHGCVRQNAFRQLATHDLLPTHRAAPPLRTFTSAATNVLRQPHSPIDTLRSSAFPFNSGAYIPSITLGRALNFPGTSARRR